MPRIRWALIVVCAAIAGAGVNAWAQTPDDQNPQLVPRTPEQRRRATELQRRVNLHVVVRDAAGKPVTGLKAEDFTVFDRGQPHKIAQFAEMTEPALKQDHLRGVIVLDAVNGGTEGVHRVRKELVKMLAQGNGPLGFPIQIALASNAGVRTGKPTTDRKVLMGTLAQLPRNIPNRDCSGPGGDLLELAGSSQVRWDCQQAHFTESLNALHALALEQQKAGGRTIMIWTGPGWPLPPVLDSGQIMPGGGTTGDLSAAIVAIEAGLEEGQVTLEAVSWGPFERAQGVRRSGMRGSLAGASLPEQEAALELPALAEETGGLALEKSRDFPDALNTCLSDGEQYYAITFDPARAGTPNEYGSIEVKVDRPGLTVRTLTGYYSQP